MGERMRRVLAIVTGGNEVERTRGKFEFQNPVPFGLVYPHRTAVVNFKRDQVHGNKANKARLKGSIRV